MNKIEEGEMKIVFWVGGKEKRIQATGWDFVLMQGAIPVKFWEWYILGKGKGKGQGLSF